MKLQKYFGWASGLKHKSVKLLHTASVVKPAWACGFLQVSQNIPCYSFVTHPNYSTPLTVIEINIYIFHFTSKRLFKPLYPLHLFSAAAARKVRGVTVKQRELGEWEGWSSGGEWRILDFLRKQVQSFKWRSRTFPCILIGKVEALEEKGLFKLNELKALGWNALHSVWNVLQLR